MEAYNRERDLIFRKMRPLDAEDCNFPGLMQKQIVYEKGYRFGSGKKALDCDIICDSDIEIEVGEKRYKVYADVYRPATKEKVPAILCIGYGGKRDTNNKADNMILNNGRPMLEDLPISGLQCWEGLDPARWVNYGYALVNVDPTGVNYSEGNMLLFGDEDNRNGYDIIEHIAALPWCTGKTALAGSSWLAMVQFFYASVRPPHLTCITPFEGEADLYRDEYVRGGMPLTGKAYSLSYRTHGRNSMEYIEAMIEKYPLINEYWRDKQMCHERIEIPAFVVGGYTSPYHTRGTPEGYNRLSSKEKWYRTHNTTEWIDLYSEAHQADLKLFFDHYLKGEDNGWERTPKVRIALFNPGGRDVLNVEADSYPPSDMKPTPLYLDAETLALNGSAPEGESFVSFDADRGEKVRLRYTFGEDTEIIGASKLRLWVESEGSDDMDVFVKFCKIDENGERVACDVGLGYYYGPDGKLRASHRELDVEKSRELYPVQKHERRLMLGKGEIVPLDIQIWPTGMIFEKGQTLELTLSTVDFEEDRPPNMVVVKNLNKGRYRVHTGGKYNSHLLLQTREHK